MASDLRLSWRARGRRPNVGAYSAWTPERTTSSPFRRWVLVLISSRRGFHPSDRRAGSRDNSGTAIASLQQLQQLA
ncbi:MAG: hypothetical protein JWP64_1347 [Pseudonocardia sp.]|jgi:hypothetical protein|nr:hypothetical protein [Pseudonocardia sp.]